MNNKEHVKPFNFDSWPDRRHSDSLKWRLYGEDVLPMWVADMDFLSPEPVIRALRLRAEHGIFGYPESAIGQPKDISALRQTIVQRMAELYQWVIEPQDIIYLPGVVTGFNLASHAIASPSQGVLIQTPVYPPILKIAENTAVLHQEMELTHKPDGSYTVDWDIFESSLTPETSLFLLCNPHNPVGKVFTRDELQHIAEICLRQGVIICSDEIHGDLVFSNHQHIPIASIDPEIAYNTITLMAPSKTFNIAGLQFSFAIIQNQELRKQYLNSRKGLIPWVNIMGFAAAQAAYLDGEDWLEHLMVYLEANRDFLFNYLQQELPEIQMGPPEGTYLAWLDCGLAGIDGNPYKFFLERGRVALNDGKLFGRGGTGFVRLNFGCPRSMLEEALNRMKDAMATR